MKLQLIHETVYSYESAVEQAHHVAQLTPINTKTQQVLTHALSIHPTPGELCEYADQFGQIKTYFELSSPHQSLTVTAHCEVITRRLPPAEQGPLQAALMPPSQAWELVTEHMQYRAGQSFDPAREFSQPSALAPVHPVFAQYALACASSGLPIFELASKLTQRIFSEFKYSPAATDASTPPLEALKLKKGVCQDFAQIMIACLRSLGLAAKYVSGYLLTEPPKGQPRMIGADASHAWVSVYCPDYGWLEFDPTNNCLAGEGHIVLGYGRDYSDVPPIRGVIRGGGEHELKVAVTVTPI